MTSPSSIEANPAGNRLEKVEATKTPRKPRRWRDVVLALSIAHLCLIQAWNGLLFERSFGYFNRFPVNRASLAALIINICFVALALWLLGRWTQRVDRRSLWILSNLAICAATLVPLNFLRTHFWQLTGGRLDSFAREPLVIAIALAGLCATIWLNRYAAKLVIAIYLILSPMMLFTAAKSAWWIVSPPPAAEKIRPAATPAKVDGPRVVWILLDELDQRIAFEGRPQDVAMPELTRFYNESFRATNAFPPGGSTRYSLPALTIGREVRGARPTGPSELSFNGSVRWSEAETVFSRARSLGFSTALVGWYHPYDRVLGRDLDRCEWYSYPPFEEERGRTLPEAAVNQLCSIFSQFQQRRLHIRHFKQSEAAALNFLTNSPAGLTLLHLPVPHHPGIYDPKRERLTAWKYSRSREYLDNLTLADRLFGRLRRAMEQAGTWEKTWVIVSSDHWWRGAAAYDGRTDHRVPFIVKGPGQNEPVLYGSSFNTVVTYHLILGILKGDLAGAIELPQWMRAFRMDPPAGYGPTGEPY